MWAQNFGEFERSAGCGYRHPVHMAFDVEVPVLHPDRMIEIDDRVVHLAPEGRQGTDPAREFVPHLLERVPAFDGVRIEFDQPHDVHQL